MGLIRQQWEQLRSNIKWDVSKEVGKWLLTYVPSGGAVMTGYLTYLWAQYNQLPGSAVFVLCLGAMTYALALFDRVRGRPTRRELSLLPPVLVEQPPAWVFPSADKLLEAVERLSNASSKSSVKVISKPEGQGVAKLLVRLFSLTGWSVQEDSESESYIFLLPPQTSLSGIRVRFRSKLFPVALAGSTVETELFRLFRTSPPDREDFPDSDAYNYVQIEVGCPPKTSWIDQLM